MLKIFHIFFVLSSFASFNIRMVLAQQKSALLQGKLFKVAPHIIDTVLLLSGIALVFQGNWINRDHGWIISKFIVLLFYIIFGIIAMRCSGSQRWLAFAATISCFAYIFVMAISKHGFIS